MRDRFLNWLARFVWRHPYSIIAVSAVLAVYSALNAMSLLQINADTNDLIARDRPYMRDFVQYMEEFGDTEQIYAVVACPAEALRPRVELCVDELTARLSRIEGLPGVFSGVTAQEQLRVATRSQGMSDEQLQNMALASDAFPAILTGDPAVVLNHANRLLNDLLQRGSEFDQQQQRRMGAAAVFLLSAVAAAREQSPSREQFRFLIESPETEYFTSSTGRLYFITIFTPKDYGTLSVIEEPLRKIRGVLDEVRAEYPGIDIGLTGKPVLQADEMATTNADMTMASLLAFALCAVLFVLMLGDPWRQILAMVAFAIGAAWTYGFATLLVGQLNLLSIVFMLVLVGVGLDYGTHILARYKEHRLAGEDMRTALREAMVNAIRGNITGALTSSTVFFMALFTTFQGLRELGLIAGVGLLLCLIAMSVVLPALLAIVDRRRRPKFVHALPKEEGFDPRRGVLHMMIVHPAGVLISAAAITVALIFAPGTISFDQNLLNLQATGLESVEWERRIADDAASNTWFGVVVVDEMEQIPVVTARAAGRPSIGEVHSVLDIVHVPTPERLAWREQLHATTATATTAATHPTTGDSEAAVDAPTVETQPDAWTLDELERAAAQLDRLALAALAFEPGQSATLRQISADIGSLAIEIQVQDRRAATQPQRPESDTTVPSTPARQRIHHVIEQIAGSLEQMLRGDQMSLYQALPDSLRQQFMSPSGRFAVLIHPSENVWAFEPMRAFIADMRAVDPHATGVPITHFESLKEMRRSFVVMSALAFLVIAGLVWLDFKRIKDVLLTMFPLVIGMVWLVELMGLLGVEFNLANFFSVPILIGVGVDSSVHILHRYHEGGPKRFSLGSTRRAVILTSLTTTIGFGCLLLAHHRGLRSLGIVMAIGALACLLASVIILPALLAWIERHPPRPRQAGGGRH